MYALSQQTLQVIQGMLNKEKSEHEVTKNLMVQNQQDLEDRLNESRQKTEKAVKERVTQAIATKRRASEMNAKMKAMHWRDLQRRRSVALNVEKSGTRLIILVAELA